MLKPMQITANATDRVDQQVDLFLDTLVSVPLKDDRALMEFPFFSIEKTPRLDPLDLRRWQGPGHGHARQQGLGHDVGQGRADLRRDPDKRPPGTGIAVERTIRFAAHDLLKVTGRGTGKRSYDLLLDACSGCAAPPSRRRSRQPTNGSVAGSVGLRAGASSSGRPPRARR